MLPWCIWHTYTSFRSLGGHDGLDPPRVGGKNWLAQYMVTNSVLWMLPKPMGDEPQPDGAGSSGRPSWPRRESRKLIKHVEKKSGWTKDEINARRQRGEAGNDRNEWGRPAESHSQMVQRRQLWRLQLSRRLLPTTRARSWRSYRTASKRTRIARARMADLAEKLESLTLQTATDGAGTSSSSNSEEDASSLWEAFERRRSQLEELRMP